MAHRDDRARRAVPLLALGRRVVARADARLVVWCLARHRVGPGTLVVAALAVRANSGPSIARVIDSLNAFEIQVLEALMVLEEPIKVKELEKITDSSARFVYKKFEELALVYEGVIPTQVRESIGAEPAGLGPRSLAKLDLKKFLFYNKKDMETPITLESNKNENLQIEKK